MRSRFSTALAAALTLAAPALAQPALPAVIGPPTGQPSPSAATLDELVAPVALYPDDLLAAVLAAATYPLDVVQAHRWIADPANAGLAGPDLETALADFPWDSSVKALVPFPQVLALMDDHLDWTKQLGDAFMDQPDAVMEAVQRLRHRAQAAGSLHLTTEDSVINDGGDIAIEPATAGQVYVPTYDPWCAYGPWPYDVSTGPYPYIPYAGACPASDDYVGFDSGDDFGWGWMPWGYVDWRHHHIRRARGGVGAGWHGHADEGEIWHHTPYHRGARPLPYVQSASQSRDGAAPAAHFLYHGGWAADVPHAAPAPFHPGAGDRFPAAYAPHFAARPVAPTFHSVAAGGFHGGIVTGGTFGGAPGGHGR